MLGSRRRPSSALPRPGFRCARHARAGRASSDGLKTAPIGHLSELVARLVAARRIAGICHGTRRKESACRRVPDHGDAMNWLDLGVVAIIVLSAVFAFARGFVREAFSVVAWVGAAAITLYGFGWAYDRVDPLCAQPAAVAGYRRVRPVRRQPHRADDDDRHSGAHGLDDRVFADRPHPRLSVRPGARRVSGLRSPISWS